MLIGDGLQARRDAIRSREGDAWRAPTLAVENLIVRFPGRAGPNTVVNDVSFALEAGRALSSPANPGSGKSMICQTLLGIVPRGGDSRPARGSTGGTAIFSRSSEAEWRAIRGAEIAMIFQDPTAALNPLITVEHQITDVDPRPPRLHAATKRGRGPSKCSAWRAFPSPSIG